MIVFQDPIDETRALAKELTERLKLLRALANFQITGQNGNSDDLANQRDQLNHSIKVLENRFSRLTEVLNESLCTAGAKTAYDPENDYHCDLVSKFVKLTVTDEMKTKWQPDSFTGSLLVFFNNGRIESSSLIEKKVKVESGNPEVTPGDDSARSELYSPGSFTVAKARDESKVNIYFSLRNPAKVAVRFYNQSDTLVRLIEKYFDEPGDFTVQWDGCDDNHEKLPKDNYYCQLEIAGRLSELKTISLN